MNDIQVFGKWYGYSIIGWQMIRIKVKYGA